MGVNRNFDFMCVWKFCCDLSSVISDGNGLFTWGCVFRWDFVPLWKLWFFIPLYHFHLLTNIETFICNFALFLIATLAFTRLLLDEIYHLIELPFDWLIDAMFVRLLDELILGFCSIDYHPCITSEPTNQVC